MGNNGNDSAARSAVTVELVVPKSPAEVAGFQAGDQILELQGSKIQHFSEVQAVVRSAPVGARLEFRLRRGGEAHTLNAVTKDVRRLREERDKSPDARRHARGGAPRVIIMPAPCGLH